MKEESLGICTGFTHLRFHPFLKADSRGPVTTAMQRTARPPPGCLDPPPTHATCGSLGTGGAVGASRTSNAGAHLHSTARALGFALMS